MAFGNTPKQLLIIHGTLVVFLIQNSIRIYPKSVSYIKSFDKSNYALMITLS